MLLNEEQWSSSSLLPGKQFGAFQEVLDRTHFHWDLRGKKGSPFQATVRRRAVNNFALTNVVCDSVVGSRSASEIKRHEDSYFCLWYLGDGLCHFRQGKNETVIRKDHISVWDSTRPADFNIQGVFNQVSILIPHEIGKMLVPGIEDICALSVDGTSGLGALLLSHLKQVHARVEDIDPQSRGAVLRATVELMGATFRPSLDTATSSKFRRVLLSRVQDYILANLGDPGLSAASIAAAFRFSPRYLHRLFEEYDVTVGTWIRKRRLEACRAELADTSTIASSITDIAMRFGFADASHFSHAFKNEFGLSPRSYRDCAQSGMPY